MKILLKPGVWLGDGFGDAPRTLVKDDAKDFTTISEAYEALSRAREYRPFLHAEIVEAFP